MLDLAGRVALVKGGGRGIGRAIARMLAEHGAAVAIGARSAAGVSRAIAVTASVNTQGGRTIGRYVVFVGVL